MVDSCGQALVDRAGDGEAADAGVEDADRRGVHGSRIGTDTVPPTPPGTAWSLRSAGKSLRWRRDVGLEPGEEMIEAEQHQPVLVLPTLVFGALRVGPAEVVQLMPGLETHAEGGRPPRR